MRTCTRDVCLGKIRETGRFESAAGSDCEELSRARVLAPSESPVRASSEWMAFEARLTTGILKLRRTPGWFLCHTADRGDAACRQHREPSAEDCSRQAITRGPCAAD